MIILCLLLAELGGFYVGFQIKNHINLMKQNRYKFFETVNGIFRLNTWSGDVKLILPSKEDKMILHSFMLYISDSLLVKIQINLYKIF